MCAHLTAHSASRHRPLVEPSAGRDFSKEERVLYPMTDDAAGDPRARHDLVERMQAF